MRFLSVCAAIGSLLLPAAQAGTASVSSYPLAVRNPYLSAWLPGNLASNAPTATAHFWAGQNVTWPVLVRVDGVTYTAFGEPGGVEGATPATHQGIRYTSTHTIVTLRAGPATVTLDFFSPVSPSNFLRQSLPYSYLTVNVTASTAHSIQVFSGVDESWSGYAGNALAASVYTAKDGISTYFNISYPGQTLYKENSDMAAWGSVVMGSRPSSSKLTYQYNTRRTAQQGFRVNGTLPNTAQAFATSNLFAISHDFGSVSKAQAVFAVGYDRAHALYFLNESYSGYYQATYPTPHSAVPAFLDDYDAAYQESLVFDARVAAAGKTLSTDYADLLELSVRQIYGAMDLVIPTASLDKSEVYVFLKEISSNGDASTVDVIFPTFPALYVLSPEWIKMLVEPYFVYLTRGTWPFEYIPHDLGGKFYPNFWGYPLGRSEAILVEATGPFFTLLHAYSKATGASAAWLQPYMSKILIAGDWLVKNGLYPISQLSTVDAIPATANQTGLSTSAAVGLKALGTVLGLANYTNAGENFAKVIATSPGLGLDSASSPTHLTYNYGLPSSWGTAFHLFPDALLGLNTFNGSVAALQASWYAKQYASLTSGGILYAYQVNFQISEWALWAGAVSDKYASAQQIGSKSVAAMHKFITNGLNNVPFPTKFIVSGTSGIGTYVVNKARPTVGSVWAWLALNGKF
ncbi:hypothetical protein GQ53DRAFT_632535 [Thozetella sp. PMI_491]|nr:hypothetical protein GQ53DRAFT_632535 [Thozetella sp. PMI_491]